MYSWIAILAYFVVVIVLFVVFWPKRKRELRQTGRSELARHTQTLFPDPPPTPRQSSRDRRTDPPVRSRTDSSRRRNSDDGFGATMADFTSSSAPTTPDYHAEPQGHFHGFGGGHSGGAGGGATWDDSPSHDTSSDSGGGDSGGSDGGGGDGGGD